MKRKANYRPGGKTKYHSEELFRRLKAFRRRYIATGRVSTLQLAKVLRVSRQTVYNLEKTGTTYSVARAEEYLIKLIQIEEALGQGLICRNGRLMRPDSAPNGGAGQDPPGSDVTLV